MSQTQYVIMYNKQSFLLGGCESLNMHLVLFIVSHLVFDVVKEEGKHTNINIIMRHYKTNIDRIISLLQGPGLFGLFLAYWFYG